MLFLAALPLLITAVLLVGFLWSATRAMPIAWGPAVVIGLLVWGVPVKWLAASSIVGVVTALSILFIVAGALVFVIAMVQVMLNTATYYGIGDAANGVETISQSDGDLWRNANMVGVLAVAVANTLGNAYPMIASLIGALGAAMTVSNVTFAQFQFTAAQQIGVPTQLVVGAQAVGGAIGNLIAIHNIVAAVATVGLVGQEGRVIRLNLIPVAYYASFVGLITMLFSFVFFSELFVILPVI